jgi:peptidyl-prolyl cis-trans isomerase B (cyclophilin B)
MKRLLTTLPLTLLLLGCGTSTAENTSANATSTSGDSTANVAATDATNTATAAASSPQGTGTATKDTPDEAYRVVTEVNSADSVPPPPKNMKVPDKVRVRLETSKGPITVELNGKEAPLHVKSFLYLSKRGYFNGTRFHRFADLMEGSGQGPGRIIQGGDPLSKKEETRAEAGTGGPGYQIPRERNALKHDRLVIAAARTQDPDSAGSQFYITQDPVYFLDEGDGYTVFGKVVEGQANALKLRQNDVLKRATVLDGATSKPAKR